MADPLLSTVSLVIATGEWSLTDEIGVDGERIARPATRTIRPGETFDSSILTPEDREAYLLDGTVVQAGTPEAARNLAALRLKAGL